MPRVCKGLRLLRTLSCLFIRRMWGWGFGWLLRTAVTGTALPRMSLRMGVR